MFQNVSFPIRLWCHNSAFMASILIVDDDPTVGMTFARILEGEGHSVTRVETASDGLSRL